MMCVSCDSFSEELTLPLGGSSPGAPGRGEGQQCRIQVMDQQAQRARQLRFAPTQSETLLWSLLRAKQVCRLKFRRQHPIGPYIADLVCVARRLFIEVDGGYHDFTAQEDLRRESYIKNEGWDIRRFSDEDVNDDVEAVVRGIANHLGLDYDFVRRSERF